jgi:hypothetical protein
MTSKTVATIFLVYSAAADDDDDDELAVRFDSNGRANGGLLLSSTQ